jgi:hypothetical protein
MEQNVLWQVETDSTPAGVQPGQDSGGAVAQLVER